MAPIPKKNLAKRSFDSHFIRQMKIKRRKGAFIWMLRSLVFSSILLCLIHPRLKAVSILNVSPLLFVADLSNVLKSFVSNLYALRYWLLLSPVLILICCCFIKRFFCRFICPLGFIVDVVALIRKKVFSNRLLRYGLVFNPRYLASFFAFFWACCVLVNLFLPLTSDLYPSPLVFDPLAIISRAIVFLAHAIIPLLALLFCFCLSPMLWRFQICPCGLFQELLFLPKRLIKKLCSRSHDSSNISLNENTHPVPTKNSCRHSATRRSFLALIGNIFLFGPALTCLKKAPAILLPSVFLPPSALKKGMFSLKCSRCGNCIRKCPTGILHFPDLAPQDSSLPLIPQTPIIDFTKGKGYCASDCVQCGQVCPTGAIRKIGEDEKSNYPIAKLQIDIQHCMLYYDQECSICRRECPYEAIDIIWFDEEYLSLPVVDSVKCVGCGRCVLSCPGEPIWQDETSSDAAVPQFRTKALSLTPLEEQL